jgi:hypothetical protein
MRADIYWKRNNITFGPDDPHLGDKEEGFHATLKVGNTFLLVPECQYNLNTVNLLEIIKNKINGD